MESKELTEWRGTPCSQSERLSTGKRASPLKFLSKFQKYVLEEDKIPTVLWKMKRQATD
jgi:hypothetical protein